MNPDLKQILIVTIPSILPAFMVGFGILINRNDSNRLGGEIAALRVRIDALSEKLHQEILTLVHVGNDLDRRISRLEEKN